MTEFVKVPLDKLRDLVHAKAFGYSRSYEELSRVNKTIVNTLVAECSRPCSCGEKNKDEEEEGVSWGYSYFGFCPHCGSEGGSVGEFPQCICRRGHRYQFASRIGSSIEAHRLQEAYQKEDRT
jgi:hypothetical protein